MDRTPRGNHEIVPISGEADIIIARGTEIKSLGVQMREAAAILATVKDGAKTRGKSLTAIKDSVGEAEDDLRIAGERYEPSGSHLLDYGGALAESQDTLKGVISEAERLWGIYEQALGDLGDAQGVPIPEPETEPQAGVPSAADKRLESIGTARAAKTTAYENWEAEAAKYDAPYETWVNAYESARSGLQTANDDGIEDSFWDDALPAIDAILTVLSYAGIVLAVAAIIIGGPILVAIAAIAGLVTLGLTIWKVAAGRGNGWDIAVAAVSIVPFGKVFGAFKGVAKAAPGTRLLSLGRGSRDVLTEAAGMTNIRQMRALRGVTTDGRTASVLHASGDLNRNGTTQLRARFSAMANASNSSSALDRLLIGHESVVSRNLANAVAGGSDVAAGRVTAMLPDSGSGSIVQGMVESGQNVGSVDVLNLVDSVAKPGGSFAYDRATGGW